MGSLRGGRVLVICRGSGTGRAIGPGTIGSGASDALGEEAKAALSRSLSTTNPSQRVGQPDDIAGAVILALTAGFVTGLTIRVEGGEALV